MEKVYKVGEVAKLCDTTIKTLRYYEQIGLVQPVSVDESSGYRYYDSDSVNKIQQIQRLKGFGFALNEIKEFIRLGIQERLDFISEKEYSLSKERERLYRLASACVKNINIPFKKDDNALGKWECIAVAESKEDYFNNRFVEKKPVCKILYLLKNGVGYDMLDGWTCGQIHYRLSRNVWEYEIDNDLMFVTIDGGLLQIYKRVDDKVRLEPEQNYFDNINLKPEYDKDAVGAWKVVDHVLYDRMEQYEPTGTREGTYFIKSLSIFDDHTCLLDVGEIRRLRWTKGSIVDKGNKITLPYKIKSFGGSKYLMLVWKDDAYKYFGEITWCYVFRKMS